MMKRISKHKQLTIIISIAIIIAISGFNVIFTNTKTEENKTENSSVLIQTQMIKQQTLAQVLQVYGEINTNKPESLSFPQAGQISQLAVIANQSVHKGDIIAVLTTDPTVRATYAQALTALATAKKELQHTNDLLQLQLATQSQKDAAEKQVYDANTTLIAQAHLGGAKASAILTAPFNGVITSIFVAQGERISAGSAIAQIVCTDHLRIQLNIEPIDAQRVRMGMPVVINNMQDKTHSISANISEIQNTIDPATKMITAIAVLSTNQQTNLLMGMQVKADIQLDQRNVWIVPRQAVLSDDKGAYLFQVTDHKAIHVDVEKIIEQEQIYGIEGKIDSRLPVVVLGNYELEDGTEVRENKQ